MDRISVQSNIKEDIDINTFNTLKNIQMIIKKESSIKNSCKADNIFIFIFIFSYRNQR